MHNLKPLSLPLLPTSLESSAYAPLRITLVLTEWWNVFIATSKHHSSTLTLILLNIRYTLKQDLQCTPAQLVYGTTLRLPGKFCTPSCTDKQLDPTTYTDRLSSYMQHFAQLLLVYNLHHHMYQPICLPVLTFSFAMMPSKSHCNLCTMAHTKFYAAKINITYSTSIGNGVLFHLIA